MKQMNRVTVLASVLLLAACGGSSGGSGGAQQQTSAETVASSSSDFSGLQKCPESGTWENYLKAEQAKDPTQYDTDKKDLDNLNAAGANDTYVAVYAAATSDCGNFGSDTPTGKVAQIYTIRFKDSSAASANFKVNQKDFHLSDSDLQNIKTAGGTVKQGTTTGLGDNSVLVELSIAGASFYAAFWQNKNFEVAMVTFNVTASDSESATTKINGRIK